MVAASKIFASLADPTRLRILMLLRAMELSVGEVAQVLGQSQPRVSRHLKLLCDAGLLDRFREGTWAFYRRAERGPCAELARTLIAAIPADDPTLALDLDNHHLIATVMAFAAAVLTRHMFVTVVVGLVAFAVARWVL